MTKLHFTLSVMFAMTTLAIGEIPLAAQQVPSSGPQVHVVVTVEARHGTNIPVINREDVMVYQGHDRDQVTAWLPLQGDHAGLELFLLIDDAANNSLNSQLQDLREFISSQPATTAVGVGYMREGTVQIVQNLTTDHAQAAKSLRLPMGDPGASPSPYFSVTDLIKRWPETQARREILMISDGIDRYYGGGSSDPYVDTAIEQAQRAGIIIYSIYSPGVGHSGHSFWRINWGQNYLSQLSDETGAESYYLGFGPPVSFVPYLDDLTHRLAHQYLLTFIAKPEKKSGMQRIRLRTEVPNAELVTATSVYVPAGSIGALINDKKIYQNVNAGTNAFKEDMEALKHNFFLRGFFKERGYESAADLKKNEISQLPGKPAEKKFDYEAKKIFDKPDTAKLKNDRTLKDAGDFLQNNRFGIVVVAAYTDMKGDTQQDRLLNATPIWWEVRPVLILDANDWPTADGSSGITSSKAMDDAEVAGITMEGWIKLLPILQLSTVRARRSLGLTEDRCPSGSG